MDVAAIRLGERVIDVGCGPGRLTIAASRAAGASGEALGIDASPEMITVATQKALRAASAATFRATPIEAIPSDADHFDVALANLMIHHLPPDLQRRGVAEVFRVLKPGGRFVIGDFVATPGHGPGHILTVLGLRRGSEHADHLRGLVSSAGFVSIRQRAATSRAFCVVDAWKPVTAS